MYTVTRRSLLQSLLAIPLFGIGSKDDTPSLGASYSGVLATFSWMRQKHGHDVTIDFRDGMRIAFTVSMQPQVMQWATKVNRQLTLKLPRTYQLDFNTRRAF